jgi:hypothetical protein
MLMLMLLILLLFSWLVLVLHQRGRGQHVNSSRRGLQPPPLMFPIRTITPLWLETKCECVRLCGSGPDL